MSNDAVYLSRLSDIGHLYLRSHEAVTAIQQSKSLSFSWENFTSATDNIALHPIELVSTVSRSMCAVEIQMNTILIPFCYKKKKKNQKSIFTNLVGKIQRPVYRLPSYSPIKTFLYKHSHKNPSNAKVVHFSAATIGLKQIKVFRSQPVQQFSSQPNTFAKC